MSLDDRNKLNRLEELKNKLFSRSYKTKLEHRDNYSSLYKKDVQDYWKTDQKIESEAENKFFMKTPLFRKFFVFSVIFFILTSLYAGYIFFIGGNTVSN